jgi:hypothetical protein
MATVRLTASFSSHAQGKESGCPFGTVNAALDVSNSSIQQAKSAPTPTLKDVPAVPFFGAFVNAIPFIGTWLNNTFYKNPEANRHNAYDTHYELYKRFGTFYTTYIPGMGEGLWPKVYIVMDPEEMKKVIRQEGAYPRSLVEGLKPMAKWMKKNGFKLAGAGSSDDNNGFLGRGETWKKYRNFMQTDLLSPTSAAGYVPGVANAAKIASRGVSHYARDLNTFFNYAAFDMFQSIMFGRLSKLADPNT